ncbi:hypothetical protein KC19_5G111900 [Ceratodon purpureus]|uniref:SigF-like NTF2-like domain-containing protein n=1 Tax=Ceratodon purpureus TaxID=3225 RepID=A0A8T0I1M9_CERPU|nr:hypothetical protein KC19_5G111900 [Ceratodon purpureus]
MEDPVREVEGVLRALVDKPTLRRQKETLEKYCTEDVEFYHLYINLNTGLKALIAVYQGAELFLNYSGVDFHKIVYDAHANALAIRMTVYIRPWLLLWRTTPLRFHVLLELEDAIVNGRKVKKIKVQRDYFIRSPILQLIPFLGEIYDSDTLRFFLGNTLALMNKFILWLVNLLSPS